MDIYLLFDIFAGLLVGWDLLIAKDTANRINGVLRDRLKPPSSIKQAFKAGIIFAAIAMVATVAYFISKDLQTIPIENADLIWIPIFFAGFAVGMTLQWLVVRILLLFTKARREVDVLNQYIGLSSLFLVILAIIMFINTIHLRYVMPLSLGLIYGVAGVEISIVVLSLLRRFLTSDPNPMENPRVIARIGLLLFVVPKVIRFFSEL